MTYQWYRWYQWYHWQQKSVQGFLVTIGKNGTNSTIGRFVYFTVGGTPNVATVIFKAVGKVTNNKRSLFHRKKILNNTIQDKKMAASMTAFDFAKTKSKILEKLGGNKILNNIKAFLEKLESDISKKDETDEANR